HGPAPRPWKAVAVDVYDVDIPGSLRDPFLQYPRAFIDQGVDEAGQDFAILDFAADNTQAVGMFLDQCVHRRVRKGSPVLLIVAVIAGTTFLPQTTELHQRRGDAMGPRIRALSLCLPCKAGLVADIQP